MMETEKLKISVVIPSLKKSPNLERLIEDIKTQELKPDEIIIVKGVSPRTRAHNIGIKRAQGDIIIFFDDDVRLGNESVIKNMLEPFFYDPKIGIVGASVILPPDASLFQKICASQLLRAQFGIAKETIESDMATHAAMAIRRNLYWEIGGEVESLRMNDDLYLRCKIREKGYKVVIAKNTWVYHFQPDNLMKLLKKYFRQGIDQAHDYKLKPDLIYASPLKEGELPRKSNLVRQVIRNLKIILGSIFKIKPILLISRLATGVGFIYGYIKNPINGNNKSQGQVEVIKLNENSSSK
ncbi:MAG: glycosyltransferase [bacterium]|nr:glycosyltransferase [bacterium]